MTKGVLVSKGDITRRTVLTGVLGATALVALPKAAHACEGGCCSNALPWSRAGFAEGSDVVIDTAVLLDRDATVASLTIRPGGALLLAPDRTVTLRSRGNITVAGLLRAAPLSPLHVHTVLFEGIDERRFVGGGMDVLASDVGLWVTGDGRLELQGAARSPWTRLARAARRGDTGLDLADAVDGWQVGDEVAVVPTGAPGKDHHLAYDTVRVASVLGRRVELDRPLAFDHPSVSVGRGLVVGAEVLNLTRNVRVEGTPGGRSHVWAASTRRQVVEHTSIRHMGPRQADGKYTKDVLGRYGLHLHMQREASRGTQVVGSVVRDCGSHAFVSHLSHGVTFQGCISHDTMEEAYWFDPTERRSDDVVRDVAYRWCVASLVRTDPSFRGYRLAGFWLGSGVGNSVTGCVAVGVQGNEDAAGFVWPESGDGTWTFTDNVSHNNKVHGSFTWQNSKLPHLVERLISFHNGAAGLSHGAYRNFYEYRDCVLFGNGATGVVLHALSSSQPLRFTGLLIDGAGRTDFGVVSTKHALVGVQPVVFQDCTFRGYRTAAVGATYNGSNGASEPELLDLVRPQVDGNEVWLADEAVTGGVIRLQDAAGRTRAVRPKQDSGQLIAAWNARSTDVARFDSSAVHRPVTPTVSTPGLMRRTALDPCLGATGHTRSARRESRLERILRVSSERRAHGHPAGTVDHAH